MLYSQHSIPMVDGSFTGVEVGFMYDKKSELADLRDLNPEAISTIHTRYYADVYRFAMYRLGDTDVAQDISSEAFTRLLEAVHNRRGPKSNIKGWLIGTTSNLVNDYFRKKYTHKEEQLSGEYMLEGDHDPIESLDSKYLHANLRLAMNELTEAQRQVIALRFSSELSLEEVARIMGKKINAIKALQFRALASLRKKIGDGNK